MIFWKWILHIDFSRFWFLFVCACLCFWEKGMCASASFIGVHISLTSGCKGLLLHRYFTSSGYTPPIHPQREQNGGVTLPETVLLSRMQIKKCIKSPQHHIPWHPLRIVMDGQIKVQMDTKRTLPSRNPSLHSNTHMNTHLHDLLRP